MAKIWANRLIAGAQEWASVPTFRQAAVKTELQTRVASGEITAEQYQTITGETYTV